MNASFVQKLDIFLPKVNKIRGVRTKDSNESWKCHAQHDRVSETWYRMLTGDKTKRYGDISFQKRNKAENKDLLLIRSWKINDIKIVPQTFKNWKRLADIFWMPGLNKLTLPLERTVSGVGDLAVFVPVLDESQINFRCRQLCPNPSFSKALAHLLWAHFYFLILDFSCQVSDPIAYL